MSMSRRPNGGEREPRLGVLLASCVVAALLLSAVAPTATADEHTGAINGTVSTEGGHPLEDAEVRLVNVSTGDREETTSGANGSFGFASVEPGEYRVEAEFGGGEAVEDVTVEEGETRSVNPEIRPEGAYFVVSVDGTNSPVTAGEDLQVNVTITNAGDETDTQVVRLGTPNSGGFEDTDRVRRLGPGSSVGLSLGMSTDLGDDGSYTAEVVTDDDTGEAGFVAESADVELSITDTDSPVAEGDNLTVEAEVSSGIGVSGRETVGVEVGGLGSEKRTLSIEGGDERSESFGVPTERGDAGNYTANLTFGDRVVDSTDASVEETEESGSETNESEGEDGSDNETTESGGSEDEDNETTGDSDADDGTDESDGDGGGTGVFLGLSSGEVLRYLGLGVGALVALAVIAASSVFAVRRLRAMDWGSEGSDEADETGPAFDAEPENDIYASWRGMIERAGVENVRTKTPSEVAESAKEAGLDPEAVDELTDVFEEMRYGDSEPTVEQERRAQEAFERIKRSEREG